VAQFAGYVLPFLAFLAFYAYLIRRARRQGKPAEVQWGWLAAIVACAGVAIVLSFFM
jgi:hypothetical protein